MASILTDLAVTEHSPLAVLQGVRHIIQGLTLDVGIATAYADERRRVRDEICAAWAAYEAHENNGHVLPSELAYADGLNEYEEGMDNE
jgi:hypothetical protein